MSSLENIEHGLPSVPEAARAALDVLPSHVALLDESGIILFVNEAWRRFGDRNGLRLPYSGLGSSYLDICRDARGPSSDEASRVLQGIREILAGRQSRLQLEYPCHSPTEERWFRLRVTRCALGPARLTVLHDTITGRKKAEKRQRETGLRLQALREVDRDIIRLGSLQETAEAALDRLGELVPYCRATLSTHDAEARNAVAIAVRGRGRTRVLPGARLPLAAFSHVLEVLRRGDVFVARNLASYGEGQRLLDTLREEGIRSGIQAPLLSRGKLIGALSLWRDDARDATPEELQITREIANALSVAVQNTSFFEAHRLSEARWRSVAENAPEYIAVVDRNGIIRSLNRAPAGFSVKDLVGTNVLQHVDPVYRHVVRENLRRAFEGETRLHFESPGIGPHGQISSYECLVGPIGVRNDDGAITSAALFVTDITEKKRGETRLSEYRKQLQSLASRLSLSEEHERRRIASELHDRAGQDLALAKMYLGILQESFPSRGDGGLLRKTRKLIEGAIEATRSLVIELSPPVLQELGLPAALEGLAAQFQERHGVACRVESGAMTTSLVDEIHIALYRAACELLANVAKHAEAKEVLIALRSEGAHLVLQLTDDGVGFDPELLGVASDSARGFGLFDIRERVRLFGGCVEVDSAPGRGTRVTLTVPSKEREGIDRGCEDTPHG